MATRPVIATVEDDRRVRQSILSVLESAGYEGVPFESAEAFLDAGSLSRFGCVIADVRLPGVSGVELQERIRQEEPRMPVIFITAHDDDDIREQALRGGAVAFMRKPFDVAALVETVARVVKAT
jgi:FixJ family two-component response regulator